MTPLPPNRLQLLLANLIYPAVLGSLLYGLLRGLSGMEAREPAQLQFLLALVVTFSLDYLYTVLRQTSSDYSAAQFLADLGIVIGLFGAAAAAERGALAAVPAWLLAAKLLALLWESQRPAAKRNAGWRFALASETFFAGVYGLCLLQPARVGLAALSLLVLLDAFSYRLHDEFEHGP